MMVTTNNTDDTDDTDDTGFSDYIWVAICLFETVVVVFVFGVYLQWNPLTPLIEIYGSNTTDTITVSEKIYDANNDWYEIITTNNMKYLTEPRNLSEQAKVNHTYSVNIQKRQIKINTHGGKWTNTTHITSLKEVV